MIQTSLDTIPRHSRARLIHSYCHGPVIVVIARLGAALSEYVKFVKVLCPGVGDEPITPVARLLDPVEDGPETLSEAYVRRLPKHRPWLHAGDLPMRKVLNCLCVHWSMHFAEIPSGFEFVNAIKSRLNAIERVRRARPNTQKILAKQYGLRRSEPILVTTGRTTHARGDIAEDFLFGFLDVFDYSTAVNGVHLQLVRPLRLYAEGQLIRDCKPVGRLWAPFYEHHEFRHDSTGQGYRLACGRYRVQEALKEFGLGLDLLLRVQEQAYLRVRESC